MLTKPSLTLKKRLKAQPAQVFSAWTDPQKLIHWFGPNETIAGSLRAEMDVRVGGRYRVSFKTKDGDGTMLTLHHEQFFDEKARDGHQRGWTGTLDKLDHYLS